MLETLRLKAASSTIFPSEVLPPHQQLDATMIEHVRRSARLLAADGKIEILQGKRTVDPVNFRGPIALRLTGK
ncbi:MAG: DUF3253 domain-containing protein [Proteobacteria bacterium]|nr:MAG: DUF3253 domain-containing protein [Pseudomonadota bacterium]